MSLFKAHFALGESEIRPVAAMADRRFPRLETAGNERAKTWNERQEKSLSSDGRSGSSVVSEPGQVNWPQSLTDNLIFQDLILCRLRDPVPPTTPDQTVALVRPELLREFLRFRVLAGVAGETSTTTISIFCLLSSGNKSLPDYQ